ncbi:patatin-like phospholipase family protein [Novipirellula caenicola]|uniref:NTE family protein Rv2565 n=1 Tax=Novipirellula caenicola TaxID=1536901 RepID=A0ABP9VMM0_9BACT
MLKEILQSSQLCCGLNDAHAQQVIDACRLVAYQSGDVIFSEDDPGDSMFIVVKGRVKIETAASAGAVRFIDHLDVGEHFGEIAMLTGGRRAVMMTAVMDCELLELKQDAFQQLILTVPGLAANACRTLGFRLRREAHGQQRRSRPRVIGIVNQHTGTMFFASRFATALAAEGDQVCVIAEEAIHSAEAGTSSFQNSRIPANLAGQEKSEWIRKYVLDHQRREDATLVNLSPKLSIETFAAILPQCEQVWWLVTPDDLGHATYRLHTLLKAQPALASRIHWMWMTDDTQQPPHAPAIASSLAQPDFKISLDTTPQLASRQQRQSLSRLIRHVHGTRIGLALGGGAARGLAHLGVLKALEREGIYFDLISGTSAGALIALPYAFGWELERAIETFKEDLTPSWFFRYLPRGNQWYMASKFWTGGWEPMLRRHFADVQLQQLQIPLSTVAVDLISGRQVIRDRGDAVDAVLESINLPKISRPILRDGMALVDGGIFNNVPADLLLDRGADLVVGVDVAAKLTPQFAGNTPSTPTEQMRRPGRLETLMRVNEVQDHEITALRTKSVDLMIAVDTSAFDFADFTQARQLAAIGEIAAEKMVPQFRQLLAEQKESESVGASRFTCELPARSVAG